MTKMICPLKDCDKREQCVHGREHEEDCNCLNMAPICPLPCERKEPVAEPESEPLIEKKTARKILEFDRVAGGKMFVRHNDILIVESDDGINGLNTSRVIIPVGSNFHYTYHVFGNAETIRKQIQESEVEHGKNNGID